MERERKEITRKNNVYLIKFNGWNGKFMNATIFGFGSCAGLMWKGELVLSFWNRFLLAIAIAIAPLVYFLLIRYSHIWLTFWSRVSQSRERESGFSGSAIDIGRKHFPNAHSWIRNTHKIYNTMRQTIYIALEIRAPLTLISAQLPFAIFTIMYILM